jgi:hypothetical protein
MLRDFINENRDESNRLLLIVVSCGDPAHETHVDADAGYKQRCAPLVAGEQPRPL